MKIAIYSRKSKFTGKGESIENQVEMCRDYIFKMMLDVSNEDISVYEDEGFSAKNLDRPQFQQMMEDLNTVHYDYIVVYRLDRISRNVSDFSGLVEKLNKKNVSFICIKEQFDTSTPMGRAMMYIASVFAQLERETIAERIKDNMNMLAKTGRWLGGNAPLGYKSQQVIEYDSLGKKRSYFKLVTDENKSKVEFIYSKFLELQSMTATAAYLIANDIKSTKNIDYSNLAVREIVTNPVYCEVTEESYNYFLKLGCQMCFTMDEIDGKYGFAVYNRKKSDNTGKRIGNNPPTEWIVALGKHPPIVSATDWLRAVAICDINKKYSFHRKVHNKDSLLSGILYCANCGHKMRPKINARPKIDGTKTFYYMCEYKEFSKRAKCKMKNVNGEIIDKIVCDALFQYDIIGSVIYNQLEQLHNSTTSVANDTTSKIENVEQQIDNIQNQIKNLMSNLMKTSSDDVLYNYIKEEVSALDTQLKNLQAKRQELIDNASASTDYQAQYDFIYGTLTNFRKTFDYLTVPQKRELLRTIINRVEWDGENVNIFIYGATDQNHAE